MVVGPTKPKHEPFRDLIECVERQRKQENEFHLATFLALATTLSQRSHKSGCATLFPTSVGAASSARIFDTVSSKWTPRLSAPSSIVRSLRMKNSSSSSFEIAAMIVSIATQSHGGFQARCRSVFPAAPSRPPGRSLRAISKARSLVDRRVHFGAPSGLSETIADGLNRSRPDNPTPLPR